MRKSTWVLTSSSLPDSIRNAGGVCLTEKTDGHASGSSMLFSTREDFLAALGAMKAYHMFGEKLEDS